MAIMKWEAVYSVEIPSIDNQHKKLIAIINDLNDAMSQGKGKEVIGGIIKQLENYTVEHFRFEEDLFRKHGYPETNAHIKQHQDLVKQVSDFRQKFESGHLMLSLNVMNFLKDWLRNHILETDKKYISFFKSKSIS